jgi:hypothetical protein
VHAVRAAALHKLGREAESVEAMALARELNPFDPFLR